MSVEIIKSFCNCCMIESDHDIIHNESCNAEYPDGSSSLYKTIYLICRGCREPSIRKEHWYFDYVPDPDREPSIRVAYVPPRRWRRPPDWLGELETLDSDLKDILDEVYSVTNDQQLRLLSMGVRAALDHMMIKILGADIGNFEKKLDKMVTDGHLTNRQKDNIAIVIDAGSASSHRGFKPPRELIKEMLSVMENLIREFYITNPMLKTAKMKIPPRPKSPKV